MELIARRRLNVDQLTSHHIPFDDALRAYELLSSGLSQLGVVLTYPVEPVTRVRSVSTAVRPSASFPPSNRAIVGMIGAGAFTKGVLLPALAKTDAVLHTIVSAGGISAMHAARKFGFRNCSTDYQAVLADDQINTVIITTRHHQHARMVAESLDAGKHVFVEKPLAIDAEGLELVTESFERSRGQQLMVGFNRRFAPFIVKMQQLLAGRTGPLCMNMVVNAGAIPADHWVHDPQIGGGRIVGEGCHWIDLLSFLAGSGRARSRRSRRAGGLRGDS